MSAAHRRTSPFGLEPPNNWQCHFLLDKVSVDIVKDHQRLVFGLLVSSVDGGPLAKETQPCAGTGGAQLPAHHIRPLIDQQWQVAPAVYPLGVE